MNALLVIFGFAAVWLGCGVLSAGLDYAYFQRQFPTRADRQRDADTLAAWMQLWYGPIGLFVSIVSDQTQHGWLFPGSKP